MRHQLFQERAQRCGSADPRGGVLGKIDSSLVEISNVQAVLHQLVSVAVDNST